VESLAWILAGIILGAFNTPFFSNLGRRWQDYLLAILLFSSSLTFGSDPQVTSSLGSLGLVSIVTALLTVAFSAAAASGWHLLVGKRLKTTSKTSTPERAAEEAAATGSPAIRMGAVLPTLAVAAGWITGLLLRNETSMAPEIARRASIASSISLALLLLVIGCDLGRQRVWKKLREYGLFAATLPIVVGAATLVGSMAAALLFSMPLSKGLAAGAGFGWYSLAGPAALAKKGAETGAYVFLSNLIREISAIVLVPLISGRTHPEVAASLGGATSMDSSLPAISRSFGAEGAAWGLIVGTVLSLACPFVIELVLAI
jgi:uncharacterized membrane protein YbjE (DUF340 family)